jgi:hypothetical protein
MFITNQLGEEAKTTASVLDIQNLSNGEALVAQNEHEFIELITAFIQHKNNTITVKTETIESLQLKVSKISNNMIHTDNLLIKIPIHKVYQVFVFDGYLKINMENSYIFID